MFLKSHPIFTQKSDPKSHRATSSFSASDKVRRCCGSTANIRATKLLSSGEKCSGNASYSPLVGGWVFGWRAWVVGLWLNKGMSGGDGDDDEDDHVPVVILMAGHGKQCSGKFSGTMCVDQVNVRLRVCWEPVSVGGNVLEHTGTI